MGKLRQYATQLEISRIFLVQAFLTYIKRVDPHHAKALKK
jgi:hypothetical protein